MELVTKRLSHAIHQDGHPDPEKMTNTTCFFSSLRSLAYLNLENNDGITAEGIDALQFSQVGIYAPAGTPEPVLNRLEQLCREGMEQEPVRRVAQTARMVVRYVPRREFAAFVQSEYEAYREILRQLGVQPE